MTVLASHAKSLRKALHRRHELRRWNVLRQYLKVREFLRHLRANARCGGERQRTSQDDY